MATAAAEAYGVWSAPYPLERWPDVELVTILCEEDRAISPAWTRWVAAHRLRTEAVVLPGGHSPSSPGRRTSPTP